MNATTALHSWKSVLGDMDFEDVQPLRSGVTSLGKVESSPDQEGLAQRLRSFSILDTLMVPRDRRGIILLCGFVGSAALGVGTVLAVGDPIGWAYIALAVVGYLFLQTRLVPTFLWLLVAAAGFALTAAGNSSGWVELGLGLGLTAVALVPVANRESAPNVEGARLLPAPAESDSSAKAELSPIQASAKAEVSPAPPRIRIRSLGPLRVTSDQAEPALEPRLQFLVGYLLARHVLGQSSIERNALAEEIAPSIGAASQKDRLRKQLYDLQKAHPALGRVVVADRAKVTLDLSQLELDLDDLVETAQRLRSTPDLIDPQTATELLTLLKATAGEFLAGFEQLEQQTTGGRGVAGEAVRSARVVVANARADVAKKVSEHFVALGRGERCIDVLTEALAVSPRQDLARLLVGAYMQTGETRLATQARRDYALTEES